MPHSVVSKTKRETSDAHGAPDSRWNSVRAVLEAIPDPAWITTRKGQVRIANRAACERYGYADKEWLGLNIASSIGCEGGDFTGAERILTEDGYYFFESRHRCRNGCSFDGEVRMRLARLQRASVCIIVAHDNTLIHEAESAFRKSQEKFKKVFEQAASGMNIIMPEGYFLQSNAAFCRFIGYSQEELRGLTVADITHPEDCCETNRLLDEVKSGSRSHINVEKRFLTKQGKVVWGAVSATWINNGDGKPEYGIALVHDISERKAIEEQLRRNEEQNRLLVNNIHDVLFQIDSDGRLIFLNPAWEKLTGLSVDECLNRPMSEFVHAKHHRALFDLLQRAAIEESPPYYDELQFDLEGHGEKWFEMELFFCQGRENMTGTLHDITAHKKSQQALERERRFLQTVIDGVVDPLAVIDLDYRVLMRNKAASGGGGPGEKSSCFNLLHQQEGPCCDDHRPCPLEEVKLTGQPVTVVHYETDPDGNQRIFEVQASPFRDHAGTMLGIIESSRDITYLFEAEEQLREKEIRLDFIVRHDPLTRLPNRDYFFSRLEKTMQAVSRTSGRAAVLLLDLDRFKNINESLGHDLGDRVLCNVATRLRECLRDSDLVARTGGDEFVIILEDVQEVAHIDIVARKIQKALSPLLDIDSYQLFVTGSLGISVYPEDGADAEALMKAADTALFRAKQKGRNTYQFYTPDMNARTCELLLMESSLRKGIEQGQLVLHYQPQVDLFTGHVCGMEALVRWNHPQRGMVSPGDFIPLAEETGLIVPMGEWVLREACRQNRRWQEIGFSPIRITVNISARQFLKGDLVQTVTNILEETGLEPNHLELEITESLIMDDVDSAICIMAQLAALGVHLAIDDFGTGYSSLAHLKRFPLTTLKIDRAFVKDLSNNEEDEAIVRAIVALAHSLDLQVIAEGIETDDQYCFLKEHGCEQGQGFLFSRPLPADQLRHFLRPLVPG